MTELLIPSSVREGLQAQQMLSVTEPPLRYSEPHIFSLQTDRETVAPCPNWTEGRQGKNRTKGETFGRILLTKYRHENPNTTHYRIEFRTIQIEIYTMSKLGLF